MIRFTLPPDDAVFHPAAPHQTESLLNQEHPYATHAYCSTGSGFAAALR